MNDQQFNLITSFLSIISICFAMYTLISSKRSSRYQSNALLLFEAEKMMEKNVELLELHNIDIAILKANDISGVEFSYILESFRAGGAYYAIAKSNEASLSKYRINLLNNPKVKIVYQEILKEKFLGDSEFVDLIESYYRGNEYHA
jgi:hypothetical protein